LLWVVLPNIFMVSKRECYISAHMCLYLNIYVLIQRVILNSNIMSFQTLESV